MAPGPTTRSKNVFGGFWDRYKCEDKQKNDTGRNGVTTVVAPRSDVPRHPETWPLRRCSLPPPETPRALAHVHLISQQLWETSLWRTPHMAEKGIALRLEAIAISIKDATRGSWPYY